MKAVRYRRYSSPEVREVTDVDPPAIGDHDVLVRVRAASLNPVVVNGASGHAQGKIVITV